MTAEHETMAALGVPDHGDYLTDGKRLVLVLDVTVAGSIEVEDAMTGECSVLGHADYQAHWRAVSRRRT